MEVSLLGAGLLGSALAERLLAAGHTLRIYDPLLEPPRGAASEEDAVRGATRVILCLPNSDITARLAPQIFAAMAPGGLVIDCTTGDPDQMAGFGELALQTGRRYIDATVGGSSVLARRGEALLLVGASPEDFDDARSLLECLSSKILHAGPCGFGARMKLVMNLALGLHRAVLAEALHLGQAMDLDAEAVLTMLRESPAASRVMDTKGRRMVDRQYLPPDARLAQHRKDVSLMLAAAHKLGIELPLTQTHDVLLARAEAAGFEGHDNSAVREAFPTKPLPLSGIVPD